MPKLLARIRRTYDGDAGEQSYIELFERLTGVDLLHIDDLGAENRTEWVTEQLYALVNERYEAQRSLIVTTNHDEAELEQEIGERVVSRLVEMCELVPRLRRRQPLAVGLKRPPGLPPLTPGRSVIHRPRLRSVHNPRRARIGHSRRPVGR